MPHVPVSAWPVPDTGLYSSRHEHDACGIGLVADLKNQPSHRTVELGLSILRRLMHRGAAGDDPETGDGAGILTALPDLFFRRRLPGLPAAGRYGVAMLFDGQGRESDMEACIVARGLSVIAWRDVPVDPSAAGQLARATLPRIRQLFVDGSSCADAAEFERRLFVIRRICEKRWSDLTFCSFSSRSIVYKGLLLATQLDRFFPDLQDDAFASPLALVHQRYSTNTFPAWKLAHPFRYLAHNGEINTLQGNLNHERAREPLYASPLFGDELAECLPLFDAGLSDSACLDRMLELLILAGRSLPHAMLMLMPQAWGEKYHLGRDLRGFFEYHSALMEPWDGPAAVAFSDGLSAGAMLDRNGLRPARYTVTTDQVFILASEAGVIDIPPERIARKGRLRPGEMIFCDLQQHRLLNDSEIKNQLARRKPYRRWVNDHRISVHGLFDAIAPAKHGDDLYVRLRQFHWSREDVFTIVRSMAASGEEPIGSMGNDAPLAIFSPRTPLLYNYFKQLFAQVTNPPIDPIREELVMSLTTYIGNPGNILSESPEHARLIKLSRPILTDEDIGRLRETRHPGFASVVLPMAWKGDLRGALLDLADTAVAHVHSGKRLLILSDSDLPEEMLPIPALLALAAVNRRLVAEGLRPPVGVIVQSGEVREVMHVALLLGYGATAINPSLALQCVTHLAVTGEIQADPATAAANYIRALDKGLLKIIAKMGISTLRSYRGAQIFEAVGLHPAVVSEFFPGTLSRMGGLSLDDLARETRERCQNDRAQAELPAGGEYAFHQQGEQHAWSPESVALLRQAAGQNDAACYRRYVDRVAERSPWFRTLRGLFSFRETTPIPLEQVESIEAMLRHFTAGAMSLGSLSPEAHEAIAVAMNSIGATSNCGEGGEAPERATPDSNGRCRKSAVRQIASGRFGVTASYLAEAREIQIKMAQGAKPGEGGQLPGYKVDAMIARVRHSTPNVTLISPPPHHDIYSIEDLAQLIYDLRQLNPEARISVKLVAEAGIGTIAAGVAKAGADLILISGHDGGTGASPLTSIKHAGLPWELGLAETQQTLVLNHLRGRVRLQIDGQLKTGRDVVVGALLGAEEFGFGTSLLICLGCRMTRTCHANGCPAGLATQDPQRRQRFQGKPEAIVNFLRLLAAEIRTILAGLGLPSLREAVGRSDLLLAGPATDFYKTRQLDLSAILTRVPGPDIAFAERTGLAPGFDHTQILPQVQQTLETGFPVELRLAISNTDRSCGTALSGAIVRRFGAGGLPDDTIQIHLKGCAGQSCGAFLAAGITLKLCGEANDFAGKGLSGGIIIIRVPDHAAYPPDRNVIAGNVTGYGATAGKIFLNGLAGERFAIRNSGATMVLEGGGDHGCEYMTGGRVVVLGAVGMNFAAGMSGGIAYVYDENNDFDLKCNLDSVDLETVLADSADERELLAMIREHLQNTGSPKARRLLNDWPDERCRFVKVFPVEYRQLLASGARQET